MGGWLWVAEELREELKPKTVTNFSGREPQASLSGNLSKSLYLRDLCFALVGAGHFVSIE
jgi:hypothetical protein